MALHKQRFSVSVLLVFLLVTSTLAARKAVKSQAKRPSSASQRFVQQYSAHPYPLNGPYRSSGSAQHGTNTRQIQQWQIAVNVPPGAVQQQPQQQGVPPGPAAPGHIWIQVPVSSYPQAPAAPPPAAAGPAPVAIAPLPPSPPSESESSGNELPEGSAVNSDPEKLKHCLEERGQFPNPNECQKFYNCWDGLVAEQSCPNGLAFSDQGPFCDYVDNVDCSQRGGAPPAPVTPAPAPPAEQGGAEQGGAEQGGVEQGGEIGGGQQEEQQQGGGGEEEEEEEGEVQEVSPEELAEDVGAGCMEPYSRYRSPKRCDVFIVCVNSSPVRFQCPATLHYNEELGICDYPYRVDCGTSAPSESSMQAPVPPPQDEVAPPEQSVPEEAAPAQVPEDVLRYYGGFAQRQPVPIGYRG